MNSISIFLYLVLFLIQVHAVYNPFQGTSMKSFVRGSSSSNQSFTIQQSDFSDAAFLGYFKFNSIDSTKTYSIMKLQISSENYSFLHLQVNTSQKPIINIIFDSLNVVEKNTLSTLTISASTWYLLGFGYKSATKTSYIIYESSANIISMKSFVSSNQLASRITQLEFCVSCTPYEYLYTQFNGVYSSIKMVTQFEVVSSNTRFYLNEFQMSITQLRESFSSTSSNLQTFVSSQNSNFSLLCSVASTIYFDGICISSSGCQSIQTNTLNQFGKQNSYYWNSSSNQCLQCPDNCNLCNSDSTCQTCDIGYQIVNGACQACSSGYYLDPTSNSCSTNCSSGYFQDTVNQICVQQFNAFYHLLNPLLVKRSFSSNNGFNLITISTQAAQSDKFSQCYLDSNSFGPYTFIGGYTTLKTEQLTKLIKGMPNSPKKLISFQSILYNGGLQSDIILKINNQQIPVTSYTTIFSSQTLCTDNRLVNVYQLNYAVFDISTDFNVTISSNVNGWGLRNFQMNITKCHPACQGCSNDGNPWSCTSCNQVANTLFMNNQCACNKGSYVSYQNCYSTPCNSCQSCPSNCSTCEDVTGKCTSCSSGYTIQNGLCVSSTSCTGNYANDSQSNYCVTAKDAGFSHFVDNKISQYLEYWKYFSTPLSFNDCPPNLYAPSLKNTDTTLLTTTLQYFMSYHYQIDISIATNRLVLIAFTNKIYYSIDGQLVYNNTEFSVASSCLTHPTNVNVNLSTKKSTNTLSLNITTDLNISSAYIFKNVLSNYLRCPVSCTQCSSGSTCNSCITNASLNPSKGSLCYCNDGYYFNYDWNNSSGLCLSCNNSCKTCSGPQITDCLTCQDGYQNQSGVCVYQCQQNQYWDKIQSKCINCSDCCQTCSASNSNSCLTCNIALMNYNSSQCYFQSDHSVCTSCNLSSGGYCGGTSTNHSYCSTKGWALYNSSSCIQCGVADTNGYCGGGLLNDTSCNSLGYFLSSDSTCLSCSTAFSSQCGDPSIRSQCTSQQWLYYSPSTSCINCTLSPSNPLCCDSSCQTCNGSNSNNCTSCISSQILFSNRCLDMCPNGYKLTSSDCVICNDPITCLNCSVNCETCVVSNTAQCKTCYSSKNLDTTNNTCVCKDSEDQRNNYFQCSYQNIAVLNILLSNSDSTLTIDFGKELLDLPNTNSGENSSRVCSTIFDATNLLLIGKTSLCQISSNLITIQLEHSALIMNGDVLNFIPSVLKFQVNSSVYIDTFLNNIAVQQTPVNTAVLFSYNQIASTCFDYEINLQQIQNDSNRGFMNLTWTLQNQISSDSGDSQIVQILSSASSNKRNSILIPKGIITANQQKLIKVQYLLKNTITGNQVFAFTVKSFKTIQSQIISTLNSPYYRFQDFSVSLTFYLNYCDNSGQQIASSSEFDVKLSSPQSSSIVLTQTNYKKNEVALSVSAYTFTSLTNEIDTIVSLSNDATVVTSSKLNLNFSQSKLIAKIIGGDQKSDYKNAITFTPQLRDLDIQDSTIDQQITTNWVCSDLSDITKACTYQNGSVIDLNSLSPKSIPGGTFNPYTAIKVTLSGSKDTRINSNSIIVFFLEFDLPILNVDLQLIDPFLQTVNLNEEIYAILQYDNTVNPDILSFSSSIVYNNNVVGAIKFDYTKLRFQLWDYYPGFMRSSTSLQIRFSVFNPYYFMPSSQIINLQINFPPDQCLFSVDPLPNSSNLAYGLQTYFTLSLSNCQDNNLPISYQFFMYLSQADYQSEIQVSKQVKRRQLNNLQLSSTLSTILPAGNLIIMAVASDSLQAVYNTTQAIQVTQQLYTEAQYVQIIDQILNTQNTDSDLNISQLSMIAEDLSKRTDLTSSQVINAKKISIINMIKQQISLLPTLSTSSTIGNKAISSLLSSGLILDQAEYISQLNTFQVDLNSNWPSTSYQSLTNKQKIIKQQQVYDYFNILDAMQTSSNQNSSSVNSLSVQLTYLISNRMNYFSLPNEDVKIYQGNTLQLLSQQITKKNLCNYLFCTNQTSISSEQPSLYNVAFKTYNKNPFQLDLSFQNFTQGLSEFMSNSRITHYPVVDPEITNTQGQRILVNRRLTQISNQLISNNSIALTFAGQYKDNLTCLTKSGENWQQKGCELIYNEKGKQYSCICNNLNPTTIVDDLEALIKNKNLQTAFGSQGIKNLSSFTEFYKYIAFWLLLINTISFIFLFIYGKKLDTGSGDISKNEQKAKIFPMQQLQNEQNEIKSKVDSLQNIPLNLCTNSQQVIYSEAKLKSNPEFRKRKIQFSQKNIKIFKQNQQDFIDAQYDYTPEKSQNLIDVRELRSQLEVTHLKEKKNPHIKQVEKESSIAEHVVKSDRLSSVVETKEDRLVNLESNNLNKPSAFSQQTLQFIDLTENDYNEKKEKFMKISYFKQTIFFHNFFGIFYVFDHEMSRSLRFSCFYVRLIHSFAISIIFDMSYNYTQMIVLSIANSLIVMIFLTLLEIATKKIGRKALAFILLCLLGFYYYIILSIVSGQSPSDSNKSMISYVLFTTSDIFGISIMSAIMQRYIALRTLRKEKLQSCSQRLFEFLHIQLILKSII